MNILLCLLLYPILFICTDFSPVWVIIFMIVVDFAVFSSRIIRSPAELSQIVQGEGHPISAVLTMAFMQSILGGIMYLFTSLFR